MKLLVIGPQTRTESALRVLAREGIRASRYKVTETGEGCMHAAAVAGFDARRAADILAKNGIRVRLVMDKR